MSALWANRKARVGLLITLSMCTLATFGGIFYGEADTSQPTDGMLMPPSTAHWFGTTIQGQDVWAQTVAGAGPTVGLAILIGLGVTLLSVLIGVSAGFLEEKSTKLSVCSSTYFC